MLPERVQHLVWPMSRPPPCAHSGAMPHSVRDRGSGTHTRLQIPPGRPVWLLILRLEEEGIMQSQTIHIKFINVRDGRAFADNLTWLINLMASECNCQCFIFQNVGTSFLLSGGLVSLILNWLIWNTLKWFLLLKRKKNQDFYFFLLLFLKL